MSYADRLRSQLKEKDLKRLVKNNPSTKKVRLAPRNYGSDNIREKKRADAGTIDFYNYGGKKSKLTKFEEMMSGESFLDKIRKGDKKNQEREDWKKVAQELGINNVDSESEVLRMIDHVMGGSHAKEKSEDNKPSQDKPEYEYKPVGDPPSQGDKDGGTASPEPLEAAPRLSGFTDNPSKDAIRGGDDLKQWYQNKFIPHLKAEADFGTASIDNDMGFYLEKFAHEPPELGDATDLFDKYKKKIDKAAD